jgi:FKBP-type peptidyl-prolyl cis-trans isomerase FklB
MKAIILTAIFSSSFLMPVLAYDTNVLGDEHARVSYAIGMMFGEQLKAGQATNLNDDLLMRGLKDSQAGGAMLLTTGEMRDTLNRYGQELRAQAEKRRQETAEKNQKAGEAFLAKNKTKKGVVTLPDGLQYKIITDGKGETIAASDIVTVRYEGRLIDGTKFDSSDKTQFQVGGVIRGWTEGLTHMKVGSKWELYIPSDLAYGSSGRPPRIEPGSTLIFEVELLGVEHPQPVTSDIIKVPSADEMKRGAQVQILKPEDVQKAQQQ